MVVVYLDYLPVLIFALAGWFISRWVVSYRPKQAWLVRVGVLLVCLGGFYKATTIVLVRGHGFDPTLMVQAKWFFLILAVGYYYLALGLFGLKQFLATAEYYSPSRSISILFPVLVVMGLVILPVGLLGNRYLGPVLITLMTVTNIIFVLMACKVARLLKDIPSCWLILAGLLLQFTMAALAIFLPLQNDPANGHYPNLLREIFINCLAQSSLLWAAIRVGGRLQGGKFSTAIPG